MNPLAPVPRGMFDCLTAGFDALLGDDSLSMEAEIAARIGTVSSTYAGEKHGTDPMVSTAPIQVTLM